MRDLRAAAAVTSAGFRNTTCSQPTARILKPLPLAPSAQTMLIAGHETTAAVLTWALFSVAQSPETERKLLAEIDSVVGDRMPGESY